MKTALLLTAALALTACAGPLSTPEQSPAPAPEQSPAPAPEPTAETGAPVEWRLSVVATGLEVPWDVAFTADGRTFVTERDSGRLLELGPDGSVAEVQRFPVDPAGEGGLLGLAVAPEGEDLFAYYTAAEDNRVVRFVPGGPIEPVVTGIPKGPVHNGGRLAFGPDGLLYVATGDTGTPALSERPDSLAGKILRVGPDGEITVFARGLRNVQGLAWDSDGRLVVSEFGPGADDALLVVEEGSDQGWGPDVADAPAGERSFPAAIDVRQPPEASWSGIAYMRGGAVPQWEGSLFAASLRGQRLWRYSSDGRGEPEQLLVTELGRLRHVAQAPDGSLWVLTSNRDGRGSPGAADDLIVRLGP